MEVRIYGVPHSWRSCLLVSDLVEFLSIGVGLLLFLIIRLRFCQSQLGRNTTEIVCPSQHMISGGGKWCQNAFTADGGNLELEVMVVSVGFFHCSFTIFHFAIHNIFWVEP